jgi:hypothetical protein
MSPILRSAVEELDGPVPAEGERARFTLLWVAPVVLLLLAIALPLMSGVRTLYLRDVINTHLEMKWVQAEAMRHGSVPLVDIQRGGGQAHLGNPNTVPLYPTNLLLLFCEPLWAVNAHFWIHWLLAPFAGYWLGRALGMRREAAWAVGVVFVTSGFYLGTLNLYNLVAPVTVAPALLACALDLARPELRRRSFVVGTVLWALMILGGDPMTAAFTLFATLVVVLVRHGRTYPWLAAVGVVGLGTGLAAPQWVEFLRILSFSYRGFWGFGVDLTTLGGWRPSDAFDLLVPFFYGRPDMSYWGREWHGDQVPLFVTYYPGILVLALMAAARGDRRRTLGWAWGLVAVTLFLALGEANPLVRAVSGMPGVGLLRIPSKLWSLVTVGAAVLCGLAFERLFEASGRRRLTRPLVVLGLVFLVAWAGMSLWPQRFESWSASLFPDDAHASLVHAERLRWAGTCFLSLLLTGFYLLCVKMGARRRRFAPLALLLVHAATQILWLRPLIATDLRAAYLERPELLDEIPAGSRVVHGGSFDLFGAIPIPAFTYPDARPLWRQRDMHDELHPPSGIRGGLRYDFFMSPEGLDSFLTRAVVHLLSGWDDVKRMDMLRASGVQYLLLNRDLAPEALDRVELVAQRPGRVGDLRVYRVKDTVDPVEVVGQIRGSRNLNEAVSLMLSEGFDPRRQVVLAGAHEAVDGEPGTATLVRETAESVEVRVSAPGPAALVVQRTHLPIYRATLDGEPTALYAADLHRIGVELPPGEHTVRIWVDRRYFRGAVAAAVLCATLLGLVAWRGLPRRRLPGPGAAERC